MSELEQPGQGSLTPQDQEQLEKLLSLPAQQRRLIAVGEAPKWTGINLFDVSGPPPINPQAALQLFRMARGHPIAVIGGAALGATAYGAAKAWEYYDTSRKRKAGVIYVPAAVAAGLVFPDPHPVLSAVYAAHPREERAYVPVADLNHYLLQDRVAECVRLMRDLGADEIDVEAEDSESATAIRVALGLPVVVNAGPLPVQVGDVGGEVNLRTTVSRGVAYYWRGKPGALANFEHNAYMWLAEDPVLMDVVESRLKGTLFETRVTLSSHKQFVLGAMAEATLMKAGHKLGAEFERAQRARLSLHVQFPEDG